MRKQAKFKCVELVFHFENRNLHFFPATYMTLYESVSAGQEKYNAKVLPGGFSRCTHLNMSGKLILPSHGA